MGRELGQHVDRALQDREFALDFYNGKYTEENLRKEIPDRYKRKRILDLYRKFLGDALRPLLIQVTTAEIQNRIAKEVGINNFSDIKTRLENGESVQDLISEYNLHALLEILEEDTQKRQREAHDVVVDEVKDSEGGLEDDMFEKAVSFFEVEEEKYFDKLTGLYSLSGLERSFEREMEEMETYGEDEVLAFISLDIDDFKNVNDLLTHGGADEVLGELGKRFASILRSSDKIGRRSGDEFVILARTTRVGLEGLLDKVNKVVKEPFRVNVNGEEKEITISLTGGVCLVDKENKSGTNYDYWSTKSEGVAKHGKIMRKGSMLIDSPDLMADLDQLDEDGVKKYFRDISIDKFNRVMKKLELDLANVDKEKQPRRFKSLEELKIALEAEFESQINRQIIEYNLNKMERLGLEAA